MPSIEVFGLPVLTGLIMRLLNYDGQDAFKISRNTIAGKGGEGTRERAIKAEGKDMKRQKDAENEEGGDRAHRRSQRRKKRYRE